MGTILKEPLIRLTQFVCPFRLLLSMLNCSGQDEFYNCVILFQESVSLKSRHNTRYIFTMEVEDIPCNSQCLFRIKYPNRRGYYTNEMYHFQSPKIGMIGVRTCWCSIRNCIV